MLTREVMHNMQCICIWDAEIHVQCLRKRITLLGKNHALTIIYYYRYYFFFLKKCSIFNSLPLSTPAENSSNKGNSHLLSVLITTLFV